MEVGQTGEAWQGTAEEAHRVFPIWSVYRGLYADSAYRSDEDEPITIASSWILKTPVPVEMSGLTSLELTLRDTAGNLSPVQTIQFEGTPYLEDGPSGTGPHLPYNAAMGLWPAIAGQSSSFCTYDRDAEQFVGPYEVPFRGVNGALSRTGSQTSTPRTRANSRWPTALLPAGIATPTASSPRVQATAQADTLPPLFSTSRRVSLRLRRRR